MLSGAGFLSFQTSLALNEMVPSVADANGKEGFVRTILLFENQRVKHRELGCFYEQLSENSFKDYNVLTVVNEYKLA